MQTRVTVAENAPFLGMLASLVVSVAVWAGRGECGAGWLMLWHGCGGGQDGGIGG